MICVGVCCDVKARDAHTHVSKLVQPWREDEFGDWRANCLRELHINTSLSPPLPPPPLRWRPTQPPAPRAPQPWLAASLAFVMHVCIETLRSNTDPRFWLAGAGAAAAATVAQGFDATLALQSGLRPFFFAVLGEDSKCFAVSRSTKNWLRSAASLICWSHSLFKPPFLNIAAFVCFAAHQTPSSFAWTRNPGFTPEK